MVSCKACHKQKKTLSSGRKCGSAALTPVQLALQLHMPNHSAVSTQCTPTAAQRAELLISLHHCCILCSLANQKHMLLLQKYVPASVLYADAAGTAQQLHHSLCDVLCQLPHCHLHCRARRALKVVAVIFLQALDGHVV
jgi:hypothetical protein